MSLWTLLCALVHSQVRRGRGHLQTGTTKLEEWNCPKSFGMLKHSEFLSLELRGQAQLMKNNLSIIPLPHNFTLTIWRSTICHSREHASTALESSGTAASDALHSTW
ncbi:hypothetical protein GOODEAATRI_016858 [Goodea atripinnis]|uniref:Secreted protein n=1 Tax=Goodea atripinnis TaxID=208336 RepID=A0ABV0NKX5_9TELE